MDTATALFTPSERHQPSATARANAVCEMLPKMILLKIAIDGDDGALIGALCLSLAFDIAALS